MKFGLFVAAAIVAHSNNKAAAGYIRRGVVQPEGMNHRDLSMEEIENGSMLSMEEEWKQAAQCSQPVMIDH